MQIKQKLFVSHDVSRITLERAAGVCSGLVIMVYLTYLCLRLFTNVNVLQYYPVGIDVTVLWSAGKLALSGAADQAYNQDALNHLIRGLTSHDPDALTLPWFYPPVAFFWYMPLALLSYKAALIAWQAGGTLAYIYGLTRYCPHKLGILLVLGFPGYWMNFLWGNNAFMITAIIAFGYYYLGRKPTLAGMLFGILCYKPHFAVMCFLSLIFARQWKAVISAVATAFLLVGLTTVYLPSTVWREYFASQPRAVDYFLLSGWDNYPSIYMTVYAFIRLLGANATTAFTVQVMSAGLAAGLLFVIWHKAGDYRLKVAAVVPATFWATPYALQYDLALLALPLIIYYDDVIANGWLFRYEKALLFLAWLFPCYNWPIAREASIQLAPILMVGLLFALVARMRRTSGMTYVVTIKGDGRDHYEI